MHFQASQGTWTRRFVKSCALQGFPIRSEEFPPVKSGGKEFPLDETTERVLVSFFATPMQTSESSQRVCKCDGAN